jgi:hypothetical protein
MRTTLTIDEDVAVELEQLRRKRRASLKAVINEALRRGLAEMGKSRKPNRKRFVTEPFDAGEVRVSSLDNVAEVLAAVEGEAFR